VVNVPGVLIVGDRSIHGSTPTSSIDDTVSNLGVTPLQQNRADKVMRIVPDNPTTGASTAGSLNWKPWFDGLAGDTIYAVTSATSNSLTVTGTPWTAHQWQPTVQPDGALRTFTVTLINTSPLAGLGFTQRVAITDNTTNTLNVASWPNGTPTNGQALFISQGRFRDYHAVAGWLAQPELGSVLSTRGGSSWQTLGLGIGYDAGLIRDLWENVWPVAPYFQLAKFGDVNPLRVAYDNTNHLSRPAFLDHLSRYNAAWTALANGNTLQWELLILDQSQSDVLDWQANPLHAIDFQNAVSETITWFRSAGVLNNANLKVLLLCHDININNVTVPLGTMFANHAMRAVAATTANVRAVPLDGLPLYLESPYVPNQNKGCYQQSAYLQDIPVRIRQSYQFIVAGNPPATDGTMPVYIYIGDSIAVGQVDDGYLIELNSPTITRTPRDARQKIWNKINLSVEPYDACDNSNTSGTVNALAGPEVSMMVQLMNLHPTTGFVLIKRATNASALKSNVSPYSGGGTAGGRWSKAYASTEHYGQLQADWQNTVNYVNRILLRQADLKGIFICLGTNDQIVNGDGAAFAAAAPQFVRDLRQDFGTRSSGPDVPVVWRVPQLGASTALPNESVVVRQALLDMQAADPEFVAMNVDDLERQASDNLHETPRSSILDGERFVASLRTIAI
jgi:hypothetical protein